MLKPVLVSLLLAGLASVAAADASKAADIIKKEGQLLISDGSSYYRFDKDGTFQSGPLGMSGRSVYGTWKVSDDYTFVIEGGWGWENGASVKGDRRRLTLSLQPPFTVLKVSAVRELLPLRAKSPPKMYSCYFVIDELVKLKPTK